MGRPTEKFELLKRMQSAEKFGAKIQAALESQIGVWDEATYRAACFELAAILDQWVDVDENVNSPFRKWIVSIVRNADKTPNEVLFHKHYSIDGKLADFMRAAIKSAGRRELEAELKVRYA